MRNRTGQPDTPFQRLGRHSVSVPNNSASFYSHDDGDSRTSMLQKYSRVMGSARARKDVSFSSKLCVL